jgi:hypothetical protein
MFIRIGQSWKNNDFEGEWCPTTDCLPYCLFISIKNSRWNSSRTSQTSLGTFSDLHRPLGTLRSWYKKQKITFFMIVHGPRLVWERQRSGGCHGVTTMSFTLYLTFVCLCHTYRNSVFVIPTLHISDICLFMSYLSEFGFRCSCIKHIGRSDLCYTYRN